VRRAREMVTEVLASAGPGAASTRLAASSPLPASRRSPARRRRPHSPGCSPPQLCNGPRPAPDAPLIRAIESFRGIWPPRQPLARRRAASLAGRNRPPSLSRCDRRQYARPYAGAHLVVASPAAGLDPPIDNVHARLHDETGLRTQPEFARSLDFSGKSPIHRGSCRSSTTSSPIRRGARMGASHARRLRRRRR